jgi:hypothetical protein
MMIQSNHAYGDFHMGGHKKPPPQTQSNRGKTKMITSDIGLPLVLAVSAAAERRNPIIPLGEIPLTNATLETDIAVRLTVSALIMAQPDRYVSRRSGLSIRCAKQGRAYPRFAI